jgi:Phospholipase B
MSAPTARRVVLSVAAVALLASAVIAFTSATRSAEAAKASAQERDRALLASSWRFERGGWIYVHLEGSPRQVGYQHGYLLAPEIQDAFDALKLQDTHRTQRDWDFFRKTAHNVLLPHIDPEYADELRGIVEGLAAHGVSLTLEDVIALNAFEEVPDYYLPWFNTQTRAANAPHLTSPGNCSAFVATGSYTKDHQIVIAHNNWTSVVPGERWRIVFDIAPQRGNRILMDGFPGIITSDDDFGVNSAGLMVTETTITQFSGFDPNGKPEFVRSRKALQYANSIDDYVRIMLDGNNGGYANDWLLGDRNTGEVARFELGLKHHRVWRSKDGYFVGSNFPSDPALTKDETTFDVTDRSSSPNARHERWEQLMKQNKGRIDVAIAEKFLSDHFDAYENKEDANERSLCGHVEDSPRGIPQWEWGPYHPGGAVQGKAMDSAMAKQMSFMARTGHPCGADFLADGFLKAHPEYDWQKPVLRDMKAGPWTEFKSGEKP